VIKWSVNAGDLVLASMQDTNDTCVCVLAGFILLRLCLQERGHIIDNLDDIDACSVDC
jgi:hypothetical protein